MIKIKILAKKLLVLVFAVLVSQCSSYTDTTKKIRQDFRAKNYSEALKKIESSSLKNSERNRLLYLLEKAMIAEGLGDVKEARRLLLQADRVVDELYTLSLSKEAATYLFNESAQAYPGEDYEKVAIHTVLALSFLKEGSLDEARVEARRINTRLNEINGKHDKKNRYSEDAFGRFLAGMIYEARGEWDSAIVDYRKALKEYEGNYQSLFGTSPPKSLIKSLYSLLSKRRRFSEANQLKKQYTWLGESDRRDGLGDFIVIHPVGHIAIKKQKNFVTNFGRQIVRFSFAEIRPRKRYSVRKTGVQVGSDIFTHATLSQNMDRIAASTLEDRRLRTIAKAGARLILKGQMTQEAEKRGGPLAGLLVNLYGAISETADTRQWSLLPSRYYVTRMSLPVGKTNLSVYNDGKLTSVRSVNSERGKLKILVAQ